MADDQLCARCGTDDPDAYNFQATIEVRKRTFHPRWAGVTSDPDKPQDVDDFGWSRDVHANLFCGLCAAKVLGAMVVAMEKKDADPSRSQS